MTRAEADQQAAQHNAAVGDDEPGVRWLVRESAPGDWQAVRVVIPGAPRRIPLKTTTESRPQADEQPDLRPLHNPLWGGPV